MSYALFSSSQQKSFLNLLSGFVLLDRNFCDEEEGFISNFLNSEGLELDHFYELLEANLEKSPREVCEKSLAELRGLSQNLKEWVLEKLYQLSLADDFLHVDEKGFLEDVNKYWGLRASFGKGQLDWTDDQQRVVKANLNERLIVTAQPGAGKTAVACAKISYLIDQGVSPSNIWLLSFTRTAVQELRDRISSFSEEADNILGVKIATIDSRAWNIRYGMREQDGLDLFSNYDLAIEDAIKILDENKEEMQEFFESLEHIIIDEAQDITGVRSKLIHKLLSFASETCGFTIFGDMAQAIYGFTTDESNQESGENLLSEYSRTNPFSFEFIELKTIHRTENTNLINLIDKLRLSILVEDASDVINPKETEKEIKNAASDHLAKFEVDKIAGLSNTLVLFRRRSDVLQATNFASQEGIDFRVRMSGLPIICRPWIGQLFFDTKKTVMETEEFRNLWQEREALLFDCGDTAFSAQNRLFDEAKNNNKIDLEKIRNLVANSVPPVNLCVQDLGQTGPIIGTVHASKGRQAENVQLFMSSGQRPDASAEAIAEESRILFVGASRAQNNLVSGKGFWRSGRSIASRRVYLQNRKYRNMAQVEFGRAGDFDIYSVVNRENLDNEASINLQQKLSDLVLDGTKDVMAKQNPDKDYVYDLYAFGEEIVWIGQFSQTVNKELFRIKDELRSFKKSLPKEIKNLKLKGLTTVGVKKENPHSFINPTFQNSGVWCVPIIFGYPNIYF